MEIKNETKFKKLSSRGTANAESLVDYTLPDYLGDVRRILFTECEARSASRFATEDKEELSGIVVYNVVYLDSENKLSSVSFTSDYDTDVKLPGDTELQIVGSPRISGYNVRLLGPRKFSAKASVSTSLRFVSEDLIAAGGTAYECEDKPISATRVLKIHNSASSERVEREYAETLERLEGSIADEVNVVYTSAEVIFDGVSAGDGEATLKGTLVLSAVISDADSPIYVVEKRVPIEESVPFPDINPEMSFIPEATIVSLTSNVNADESGSEVVLSALVEYAVIGEYNELASATTDAYMRTSAVENTYSDYYYSELVDSVSVSEPVSVELTREEIFGDGLREIVYTDAVPRIESAVVENGKIHVKGDMRFSGLGSVSDEDGEISYSGFKFNSPFELFIGCHCNEGDSVDCILRATAPTAVIDTDSVRVSCGVIGNITVSAEGSERILLGCDAVDGGKYESVSGRITVYYPEPGETLFSVAKEFHTTPEKIAEDNSLAESVSAGGGCEPLNGVKRIFIY